METKYCKFCQTEHPLTEEFWYKRGSRFTCRAEDRKRSKQWKTKNPEKYKESLKRWHTKNPEKHKENCKKYYAHNSEKIKAEYNRSYAENPEKFQEKNKRWKAKNQEKHKESHGKSCKKWRAKNSEKDKKNHKKYEELNKEKRAEQHKVYYISNKDKIAEYRRDYRKKRLKNDPKFKYIHICRQRTLFVYKSRGLKKTHPSLILLGCNPEELRLHLEKQFKPGMTHDNHGRKKGMRCWEIDHIRPIDSFSNEELDKAFHYTNLQPLWVEENRSKWCKWDGEEK